MKANNASARTTASKAAGRIPSHKNNLKIILNRVVKCLGHFFLNFPLRSAPVGCKNDLNCAKDCAKGLAKKMTM